MNEEAQRAVIKQADEFTLIVERFMRTDHPIGIQPATDAEVADAMYALRAAIVALASA